MYEIFPALVADDSQDSPVFADVLRPARLALIGGFLPRRCGIATFTTDMHAALKTLVPGMDIDVYAMAPAVGIADFDTTICCAIAEADPAAYLAAARRIEANGADVIWLQHEFGLFGGPAGDVILDLLDHVAAPVIVTLHTVLAKPDPDQMRVMTRLIARASKLVVMSDLSRRLLQSVYGADDEQIELIAHGVPDRPFGRSVQFKARFGFEGRKMILTFGLLSKGKGIEAMIHALPQIAKDFPDVLYCIAGATHPNLIANEGEAYRQSLQTLASELGVGDHIRWIDAFLDTVSLLDLIEAADIFVTPYIGAEQSTSGTLAYAMALGKAIVSTPYAHAAELLADDHGRLVPFGDSAAMASEIRRLLDDPARLHDLQQRAYSRGREMIWPRFARRTLDLIDTTRLSSPQLETQNHIGTQGLLRLCDNTGILQHSIHSIPDRRHGYCVDDNARALMLMHRLHGTAKDECGHLTTVFASFVQHAWNADTLEFRNFMGFARNWLEDIGSEDSCGRTIWAIGVTARHAQDAGMRRWASELFADTAASALGFQSPRAIAFAMLGAASLAKAQPRHALADAIMRQGADRLKALHGAVARQGWNWFEDVLAYDNCRLSEAMLRAGVHHEYSYAAAAVMNPSVVRHPDQTGLDPGSIRILLSLRAVGEGHISTIAFREGTITAQRELCLTPQPTFATAAMAGPATNPVTDDSVTLHRQNDSSLSGTVIFPITEAQRNGLEDLRLVEFQGDDGRQEWIGTYTAYSGRDIRSELLRTHDFKDFALTPIKGGAGRNKGMALFPRKIDGKFCMIGRQDGKNLYLLRSDSLDHWEGGTLLLEPRFPWELVQIGNCGAPIELDEGWLVLTHGVGAMRKYAIGAMLLDKADPSRVLGRTANPILSAADEDREGYVPNVVYTCGAIRVGDDIFLPYGVADSSVCFAFLAIADMLAAMDYSAH